MLDCHLHTQYSPDGCETIEAIVARAAELKLKFIALTDHMDTKPGASECVASKDLPRFFEQVERARRKYPSVTVSAGTEAGWTKRGEAETARVLSCFPFEYVINSIHDAGGTDCYYKEHYEGKTRDEAYNEYFEAVENSLDAPYRFDAVGHLGYIERTAPYPDKRVLYGDFRERFDSILSKIIKRDVILEFNTSVYKAESFMLPSAEIAGIYYKMGGRLITLSSDAHKLAAIAHNFRAAAGALCDIGFREIYGKKNGAFFPFPLKDML